MYSYQSDFSEPYVLECTVFDCVESERSCFDKKKNKTKSTFQKWIFIDCVVKHVSSHTAISTSPQNLKLDTAVRALCVISGKVSSSCWTTRPRLQLSTPGLQNVSAAAKLSVSPEENEPACARVHFAEQTLECRCCVRWRVFCGWRTCTEKRKQYWCLSFLSFLPNYLVTTQMGISAAEQSERIRSGEDHVAQRCCWQWLEFSSWSERPAQVSDNSCATCQIHAGANITGSFPWWWWKDPTCSGQPGKEGACLLLIAQKGRATRAGQLNNARGIFKIRPPCGRQISVGTWTQVALLNRLILRLHWSRSTLDYSGEYMCL